MFDGASAFEHQHLQTGLGQLLGGEAPVMPEPTTMASKS
jgi:hypothetical protein